MEKPFGRDLESARALNAEMHAVFDESQIFRIDHYLGKETVQNVLAFRFANGMFEPIWNRRYVDNVQITVAEAIGIEGRAQFYEQTGTIRDMVATHLVQVLTFLAMEPPVSFEPDRLRDEKVKVLRAMKVCDPATRCAASTPAIGTSPTWHRIHRPRPTRRSRWRSTTGAGPACRSSCGPAST
jgi:glucose-6-phosphate 1-dehydrogenase